MSKKFTVVAIFFVLLGLGLAGYLLFDNRPPAFPAFSDQELADKHAEMDGPVRQPNVTPQAALKPLDLSHPVRLAIGGLGLADNDRNQQLGDLLTARLTGAPGLDLVERRSMAAIMRELDLSFSGFVRAGDAVRAGRLLKADWFLLGTQAKINGTNYLVVRVVDAHTGIMLEAGVVSADQPAETLATDLAAFLQDVRKAAVHPKPRIYLAFGGFEDASLNDRRADFPQQLRGYLTSAYRNSNVTLLEREYVEVLLSELRLDLAGLTEETGSNPPARMQSAYWLVSGEYQSYETTNFQIELNLTVRRAFGRLWRESLRGPPGDAIGQQARAAIDQILKEHSGSLNVSRTTEVNMQMNIGMTVCDFDRLMRVGDPFVFGIPFWYASVDTSPQFAARTKRNLEEAMRAFKTVLILEPTNQEARIYLATCCRATGVNDLKNARSYYREVIDAAPQDKWAIIARRALAETFRNASAEDKLRWMQAAAATAPNPGARAFYAEQAEVAREDVVVQRGDTQEGKDLAWNRLLESIGSCGAYLTSKAGTYKSDMGMDDYIAAMRWDRETAAKKVAELLPKMQEKHPKLAEYLLATAVTYQTDPNAPIVTEFEELLDACGAHPETILKPDEFWNKIRWDVYRWCVERTNYLLAAKVIEGERNAALRIKDIDFDDQETIKLAYAYLAMERWNDALELFESFHGRPVQALGGGPWGEAFQSILTDKMAAYCRGKLGMATKQDPRIFDMGKPLMCLCSPSTFVSDANGLWVAIAGHLMHVDFDLRTNLDLKLPCAESIPVRALCLDGTRIWIGTGGAGLLEFDKESRQFHRYAESDGLLMNELSCLALGEGALWIGYGNSIGGGLGKLELQTRKPSSFIPELNSRASVGGDNVAPNKNIEDVISGPNGEVWVRTDLRVCQFDSGLGTWSSLSRAPCDYVTSVAADSQRIVVGGAVDLMDVEVSSKPARNSPTNLTTVTKLQIHASDQRQLEAKLDAKSKTNSEFSWVSWVGGGSAPPRGVVIIQNLGDKSRRVIEDPDATAGPPTAMAVDGNNLWVGGRAAIGLIDLRDGKVRKFCRIKADAVDRLEVAGGYLWAQFDWHLYRAKLTDGE